MLLNLFYQHFYFLRCFRTLFGGLVCSCGEGGVGEGGSGVGEGRSSGVGEGGSSGVGEGRSSGVGEEGVGEGGGS